MLVTRTITNTTSVIHMTRRNRNVEKSSLNRCTESIAASSDRMNQRLFGAALELGPEPIDVYLDDVGGAFPVGFPQALAQHLACDDLAGVAHEHFQDAELGRGKIDFHAAARDAPRRQIEDQVADLQHRRR